MRSPVWNIRIFLGAEKNGMIGVNEPREQKGGMGSWVRYGSHTWRFIQEFGWTSEELILVDHHVTQIRRNQVTLNDISILRLWPCSKKVELKTWYMSIFIHYTRYIINVYTHHTTHHTPNPNTHHQDTKCTATLHSSPTNFNMAIVSFLACWIQ